jgi:hypothetical protein
VALSSGREADSKNAFLFPQAIARRHKVKERIGVGRPLFLQLCIHVPWDGDAIETAPSHELMNAVENKKEYLARDRVHLP